MVEHLSWTKQIFLAEDDEDDALFFELAVKELLTDVSVTIFSNGQQLMTKLERHEIVPDLIFIDLNMPIKNGFECLQEIKSNASWNSIKTIILSTTSDHTQIRKCYALGADTFVTKASSFDQFKLNIKACLL